MGALGRDRTDGLPQHCRRQDRQQRDAEEHPAPTDDVGDGSGDCRTEEGGEDPGAGEDGEDARPQFRRIEPGDHDVEADADESRSEPLDSAADQEDRHRRREPRGNEAGGEHPNADTHRGSRSAVVHPRAGKGQREDADRHRHSEGKSIDTETVEVVGDDRHDRRDGERLEGDQECEREDADRRRAELPRPWAGQRGDLVMTRNWCRARG